MITKVKLPKADANMNEGTIGKWFFKEGDEITKGEPIVEVITDKTVFEFESPKSGILRKITAPVNSVIPPGYVMALIGKVDDALPDVSDSNKKLLDKHLKEQEAELSIEPKLKQQKFQKNSNAGKSGKVRATPAAKRLAKENKLDLAEIKTKFNVEVVNEKAVRKFLERA